MVALTTVILFLSPLAVSARLPNDPEYARQAAFWEQVQAPAAWDETIGNGAVVLAIIDTGSDYLHPDLATNIWVNPYETPFNEIDDDNNGYVDDVHGWNFVENNNNPRELGNGDLDPDAVRHAAIGAGLAGAVGDNNRDGVGAAWRVKMMLLRTIDSYGYGSSFKVAQAVDYAVQNGADIISMSFVGENFSTELYSALIRANQAGVLIVAAAGNHDPRSEGNLDAKPLYPACFKTPTIKNLVLGVGSVDQKNNVSVFSNFGSCVDIYAPGENIYSTEWYDLAKGFSEEFGGPWNGTSFATPIVAGAAALVKSLRPAWTPEQIADVLVNTAEKTVFLAPKGEAELAGRLNMGAAVKQAKNSGGEILPFSSIFYAGKNQLWRYDILSEEKFLVKSFAGATLVDWAVKSAAVKRQEEGVALLRRGSYYYLNLFWGNGRALKELSVDLEKEGDFKPRRVAWQSDYLERKFMVEFYSPRFKQTKFVTISATGERQGEMLIAGSVADWALLNNGKSLAMATLTKKVLNVREFDISGKQLSAMSFPSVDKIVDFTAGNLFGGGSDQAAALVLSGKILKQFILDLPSQSYRQEVVATVKGAAKLPAWKILLGSDQDSGRPLLLRWHPGGGKFGVVKPDGSFVTTLNLANLAVK